MADNREFNIAFDQIMILVILLSTPNHDTSDFAVDRDNMTVNRLGLQKIHVNSKLYKPHYRKFCFARTTQEQNSQHICKECF